LIIRVGGVWRNAAKIVGVKSQRENQYSSMNAGAVRHATASRA
jgi:hypothetical protein